MSRTPLLCSENLLNVRQFTGHTLSAEEEAAGFPVENVANGRRAAANRWQATTANSASWIRCVFDRPRAVNFVALDRGHNLAGKGIDLKLTMDATDFTGTFETPVDITLPSVSAPGDVDDYLGVRTLEGAWVKRFPFRVAKAVQFGIDAMGAGLVPQVVGLWVGLAWDPGAFNRPFDDEGDQLLVQELAASTGWVGRDEPHRLRGGLIEYELTSDAVYDEARYHLLGHYGDGYPSWLVFNQRQADRAILVIRPAGDRLTLPRSLSRYFRHGAIAWQEHQPAAR